jgi:NAD(P)-dependent dehydrogenase (short-subunit alcohol dehydrogenase family)
MTEQRAARLDGKVVVVTGASAGVGAAAARRFAELGATVAVVGRSPEKTAAVAEEIDAKPFTADFTRLTDVRRLAGALADRYPRIDVLANNAGGRFRRRTTTEDGHEAMIQVHHLAPFLLTHLLAEQLKTDARVISTSSAAHAFGRIDLDDLDGTGKWYGQTRFYATSKLAGILFARELARRGHVTAAAFHPGIVASDFFRDGGVNAVALRSPPGRLVTVTPEQGAEPLVHPATVADARSVNGAYLDRMARRDPKGRQASDAEFAKALWDRTAEVLGLTD